MLHDPKHDAPITIKPTIDGLRAFLKSMPSTLSYPYDEDPDNCAMEQYLRSIGTSLDAEKATMGRQLNFWMGEIASPDPHTFGAASIRAQAYEE